MALIEFIPTNELKSELAEPPKPMSKVVPEWFRKFPSKIEDNDTKLYTRNGQLLGANATVKKCMPFLDAMTGGYTWTLPCDLEFKHVDHKLEYAWACNIQILSEHIPEQFSPEGLGQDSFNHVFKWLFDYVVKTPSGYSTLFTHPLNRNDLPFTTFAGIVDTDTHPVALNFPFKLNKFEGDSLVIPEGTPIVQMIPFKREQWDSKVHEYTKGNRDRSEHNLGKTINAYKNNWWNKKSYR